MQLFFRRRNNHLNRSVVQPPQQLPHKDLYGRARLFNVIQYLHVSCPWSKSVTSETMLDFLESEIKELRDELTTMKKCANEEEKKYSRDGDDDNTATTSSSNNKAALVSEVGDIIFDVLMLEMALKRYVWRCLIVSITK